MGESALKIDTINEMSKELEEMVEREHKSMGKPTMLYQGVRSTDIWKAYWANEIGDGWLFKYLRKDRLCYDHAAGQWYEWNGNHWEEDRLNEAIPAIDDVVDEYGREVNRQAQIRVNAAKAGEGTKADEAGKLEKGLLSRILALQTLSRRRNVLAISLSGRESLGISGDEWDADPLLLGSANGVIHLESGSFRSGMPEDYILKAAPTEWKGLQVAAPTWERFLMDIFNEDIELISYVQRLLGYSIAGHTKEHILPVFWGEGRNGKGTLLEVISHVLGPIAGPIPSEMLLSQSRFKSSSGPSPDRMALRGRRTAWASETEEGRFLDVATVKLLVGGDTLTARPPYGKRQIEFQPTHTLFLLTNHKPHIAADEYAMWQRLHLIPFIMKFVDDPKEENERERDPYIKDKLLSESPGILAWLVRGFLQWNDGGLNPPELIKGATKEYQSEEDLLGHFVEDYCQIGMDETVRANDFYHAFKKWCLENGHRPMSNTKFGRRMGKRFSKDRDETGNFYRGVIVADEHLPCSNPLY